MYRRYLNEYPIVNGISKVLFESIWNSLYVFVRNGQIEKVQFDFKAKYALEASKETWVVSKLSQEQHHGTSIAHIFNRGFAQITEIPIELCSEIRSMQSSKKDSLFEEAKVFLLKHLNRGLC